MGAYPGPACYGKGGEEPTNTDCQIVLGRIDPDFYLGGELTVDASLSRKALSEKIGSHYGWSAEESAANMYMVAMANLMMAMRIQTVARGWDPRDFAIVPYGGGGSLYACDLARELGSETVVVPPLPGYASAYGAIRVDMKQEFTSPIHRVEEEIDFDWLNREFDALVNRAVAILKSEGIPEADIVVERLVDVKYFSQSRFFTVGVEPGRIADLGAITVSFMAAMKDAYGYTLPPGYAPVEVENLRVVVRGRIVKPDLQPIESKTTIEDARMPRRNVWFKDVGFVPTDIYRRHLLPPGATFDGPAILEQHDTTVVMPPRTHCRVDNYGNLIIQVER
jgi:N-methylhydantoinase A